MSQSPHSPADKKASPAATSLLASLYTLQGNVTLSAQHDYISSGTRYREQIREITGTLPPIFGGDFSFCYQGEDTEALQHCGPANLTEPGYGVDEWERRPEKVFEPEGVAEFRDIDLHHERLALVDRCKRLHAEGCIITLMWHGPVPDRGDLSGDRDLWAHGTFPEERWRELLTPWTPLHQAWETQVDHIARYLKMLAEADIPVLWRPYHEMNGGWFWWGEHPNGEFGFNRLWDMMYKRYTEVHDLHNLLWVWNPNAPRDTPGDEAGPYEAYYPGHHQVDILATDIYHNDYQDSHYDQLVSLANGRPIALGEVGHVPTPDLLEKQPLWSWVMPWGGLVFRFNSDETLRTLYTHLSPST